MALYKPPLNLTLYAGTATESELTELETELGKLATMLGYDGIKMERVERPPTNSNPQPPDDAPKCFICGNPASEVPSGYRCLICGTDITPPL